jgi:hypothetical protein
MVVRSICFGLNIFSLFGINRQKRRRLRALFTLSPLVQVNTSEGLYQLRVCGETTKGK